jgi:nitrite reductase/ring-hydroxylating ferredoxin subunit
MVGVDARHSDDPELHTVPPDRAAMEGQPKWRRDFPIDTPQDQYVARRDFTRFLVLTSMAFVVGQFWIATRNLWRKGRGRPPVRRIARLDELPVGGAVTFHYPSETDPALLIRADAETLLAYASQCTHLQCPVLPEVERERLHCPCHAGYFDLHSGRPTAGPPRRNLPRIALEVRDGAVYATDIEEESA